jgi:hypothetical protein
MQGIAKVNFSNIHKELQCVKIDHIFLKLVFVSCYTQWLLAKYPLGITCKKVKNDVGYFGK